MEVAINRSEQTNVYIKAEAGGERKPELHTREKASLCACTYRDSALKHAHLNSHTQRVCRWAKGVGEGLGGWYKASSEYTKQPPLSRFNMADAASWVRLMYAGSKMIQDSSLLRQFF